MTGILKENKYGCKTPAIVPGAVLIAITVICICLFFVFRGSRQAGGSFSETRLFFDTFCTITIPGAAGYDEEGLKALVDEAFALCREYEQILSMTAENSDIWRINHAGGSSVPVHPATVGVVTRALEFSRLSGGKFDITIGALSRLWGFSRDDNAAAYGNQGIPSEAEIERTLETVGFMQVSVDYGSSTITVRNPDTWLDPGGIAKGYIADEIALFLAGKGIENALIDLGGDIAALGTRADGNPWRLGVRQPFGTAGEFACVIEVSNAAVVSSGIYERMFEYGGRIYHHILDPVTGSSAESDIIAATVIAADAVTGEGLSTIAILAGSGSAGEIFNQAQGFIGAVIIKDNFEILTFGSVNMR